MNQYTSKRKVPALLKSKDDLVNFKIINDTVEFNIDGERVTMPTAEAFHRLLKKVTNLEQRLAITDNKASRNSRSSRSKHD